MKQTPTPRPTAAVLAPPPQAARARIALGPFAAEAELVVSPAGLLAAGALVAMILLSIPPIIRAAKTQADRPPS